MLIESISSLEDHYNNWSSTSHWLEDDSSLV